MNILTADKMQIKICDCCGELMFIDPVNNSFICECGTEYLVMVENGSQYWNKK